MDDKEIFDPEDSPDAQTSPQQPVSRDREGVPWAAILIGIWAISLVIFSVQNAEDATVQFLGWSFETPVAILVIVTALATLLLTGIGSAFYRRRRRKQARLKREHQELDESGE